MSRRTNIVIVGGGLAGMAAAIEALRQTRHTAGITIELLEKEAHTGGNSAKASSGISGVLTRTQKNLGINDSIDAFFQDTIKSGRGRSNETLVQRLASESASAVFWLQNDFALDLDVIAQLGGHSFPRTHRRPDANGKPQPVGWGIVSALDKHLKEQAKKNGSCFRLTTGARVTKLLSTAGGRVSGIFYESIDPSTNTVVRHRCKCDVVVLATGGFGGEGGNPNFLKKYAPQLVGLPATNGPFAAGDGLRLATAVGAGLVDMDQIQVHPTGFVQARDPGNPTKFLAAEALRGEGGILLNGLGKRFVDELGTRDRVTTAITKYSAYLVLSQPVADSFGHGGLGFYEKMGLMNKASSVEELATAIRVELTTLNQTLTDYDKAREGRINDEFGKTAFPQSMLSKGGSGDESFYFWCIVTPSIHYTMGGLRFDENARVLASSGGQPIPGLLAAGEVTGGLHGANRLGGNSLLECIVYGRRAGRQAA
ncbi:FAD binding domain-containing protein, partial [Coemansia spiralis]